jgi:hypothetical protein
MSEYHTEHTTRFPADKYFSELKDKAILLGWIAGLLLLLTVLWVLTSSVQSNNLLRSINGVFINNDDERRVLKNIQHKAGKADLLGYWYSMLNSTDRMFVFGVFQDGILIPVGAILSENGTVKEILPLSAHASQVYENMPKSILQMYINRIEENKGSGR